MKEKRINIVIVDSGVDINHKQFSNDNLRGFTFHDGIASEDFQDEYGHGTAIFGIIQRVSDFANIINIKIPSIEIAASEDDLIHVLQYINRNMKCDILNLSLGINVCRKHNQLKLCCEELTSKGTIIVAAFDNNGIISFPAAFSCVIGVVSSQWCKRIDDFQFIDDDVVNIAAKGNIQRVAWKDSRYLFVGGNSFACAHATVQIAKYIKDKSLSIAEIKEKFKSMSITNHIGKQCKTPCFNMRINKAAVFPFNKEMHSLIRYDSLLSFNIVGVYDIKYSPNIGLYTSNIINNKNVSDYLIKRVDDIDWETFDTLIIGHLDKIYGITQAKEYRNELIENAINKGKNIFSFDDLSPFGYKNSDKVYYPIVTLDDLPPYRFGMLYRISKPVVGVFGTSSKQGKFTTQLKIRELLQKKNYKVGQIGTEPSSKLFGIDYCYPFGYNSSVYINGNDQIRYLNYIMHDLCENDMDVILVGSQSNTIPYDTGNIRMFTSSQFHFLMGSQPDCVVLVVNPYDKNEYIQKTIIFLESCTRCRVIALVLFPMTINDGWKSIYGEKRALTRSEIDYYKHVFERSFNKPVFTLGREHEMESLTESIIEFFAS